MLRLDERFEKEVSDDDEVSTEGTNCIRVLSPEGVEEDFLMAFLAADLQRALRVLALEADI